MLEANIIWISIFFSLFMFWYRVSRFSFDWKSKLKIRIIFEVDDD